MSETAAPPPGPGRPSTTTSPQPSASPCPLPSPLISRRILFVDHPVEVFEPGSGGVLRKGAGGGVALGTRLVPGDYAVVRATDVAGHTLRGEALAKATLGAWGRQPELIAT